MPPFQTLSVPDSFPKDFKPLTLGKVSNAGTFGVAKGHYGWEVLQNLKGAFMYQVEVLIL
jgi:hypothetical protein